MEGQWKFGYFVVCQLLYLSWLQEDCLNVMHVLQMSCISMLTQCLGCPGDWLEVARCAETCSDNFAVNISFAWSNSLTLTNKSIFQAHIAICGAGRGEEACFLVRYPLNSDQCSVWWQPQSRPVAEWTDCRGRVWPSQHYISVQTAWTFSHYFPSTVELSRLVLVTVIISGSEYVSVGEWSSYPGVQCGDGHQPEQGPGAGVAAPQQPAARQEPARGLHPDSGDTAEEGSQGASCC